MRRSSLFGERIIYGCSVPQPVPALWRDFRLTSWSTEWCSRLLRINRDPFQNYQQTTLAGAIYFLATKRVIGFKCLPNADAVLVSDTRLEYVIKQWRACMVIGKSATRRCALFRSDNKVSLTVFCASTYRSCPLPTYPVVHT